MNDKIVVQSPQSCPTHVTPWTVACQVPPSVELPRQEYWSGLLFPSPGDLPKPGIELTFSCIGRQILYHRATKEAPSVDDITS